MRCVYFIRPIGMQGPIKIGCSISPDGRRTALDNWSPFPLEIVAQIEGDFELEHRFHAHFQAHHERREWFTWSQDIEDAITAINAGVFDVETLPDPMVISCRIGNKPQKRTPEQRLGLSYSLRISHLARRTGYAFRERYYGMVQRGDAEMISKADAYLAAPHVHGHPIPAPWAERRRKAREQAA